MASWYATGLLEPLWGAVGGRDRLAAVTGIQPGTLSGYNTGRLKLGLRNAKRLAAALGVSVFDLGAPEAEADAADHTILGRLAELEAWRTAADLERADLARLVDGLVARVDRLEDLESKRRRRQA